VKPLILSLVVAVISTTIGAGWLITEVYSRFFSNNSEIDQNLHAYKQLGKAIGQTLENFEQQDEFVRRWKEKTDLDISFQNKTEFPLEQSDQVMSMLLPISQHYQKPILNILLTLLFYFVVIVVLLAWLYPLVKRLVTLQSTAIKFGQGDLSSRIELSNFSYITSIEHEFNRMAAQIQKLIDDNQLLSRAVSHNLKTPITRLRMGVDVLEETSDESAKERYIKRINSDLDEMQSLVETLLQYSSLDGFKLTLKNEPIDLREFIPNLLQHENAKRISISTTISDENVVINTDPQYLAMSLNNIFSNAVQHAKSTVLVRVERLRDAKQHSAVSISVEDDGVGIPEAQRTLAIKPFWRGNNNPAIKGHGMGLAIVTRIANWLNAELAIDRSTCLGGASVKLLFRKT